jgi:hypothetical protein
MAVEREAGVLFDVEVGKSGPEGCGLFPIS